MSPRVHVLLSGPSWFSTSLLSASKLWEKSKCPSTQRGLSDQQYRRPVEHFRNSESQAQPMPTESQSAFYPDLQVIHSQMKIWEALLVYLWNNAYKLNSNAKSLLGRIPSCPFCTLIFYPPSYLSFTLSLKVSPTPGFKLFPDILFLLEDLPLELSPAVLN